MDEETKTRLKHIRDATRVNRQHFVEQRIWRLQRYELSRQKATEELYGNKNINYRKHMNRQE